MAQYAVHDLVGYLGGAWELTRHITDPDGAEIGTFTGTAEFIPDGAELCYREQGEVRMPDYHGTASRMLHYRPEETARCSVWFDDGHFFHDLRLDSGVWQVRHPCRADLYRGSFEAAGPDQWRQHWRVSGPAKAYETTTLFTRKGA